MGITNEEAITIIKNEFSEYADTLSVYAEKRKEAFDMAIKALEQQPCEDCISRQAVLDKKELVELEDGQSFYCINPKDVETLPSVTPSRPKGCWISHIEHCKKLGLKPSGLGAYEWCSKCDCGVDIIEFYSIHYNFCPNCGADMRESEDKE